jgi:hypothetical protein
MSRMSAAPLPPALPARAARPDHPLAVAGVELAADAAGALYWPEHELLAVADLHLEKGSSFARRGVLLPPYDTALSWRWATASMTAAVRRGLPTPTARR